MYENACLRLAILSILTIVLSSSTGAQVSEHPPQLLLTPQRLKRLKRDRERQTPRWISFEARVKSVPDSPERGFELALYYAVTGDESRGKEAVTWALQHQSEFRQIALIYDWCKEFFSTVKREKSLACLEQRPGPSNRLSAKRDCLFTRVAENTTVENDSLESWQGQVDQLVKGRFQNSQEIYAAAEIITVLKASEHVDIRQNAPQFFNSLPIQFLLSLKPDQVEHPDWMTHITALALVSLAPNNDSSQFLQGWAIEDRQTIREGPGVAYELLWADPYLPGVGYQNLDPWWYDETRGTLLGRSNWEPSACWIKIALGGLEQQNCPVNWQTQSRSFGHMQLIPMTQNCLEISRSAPNSTTIIWKLKPNGKLKYTEAGKNNTVMSDASGLLRLPANAEGKACVAR